jgi:hypothetical protein
MQHSKSAILRRLQRLEKRFGLTEEGQAPERAGKCRPQGGAEEMSVAEVVLRRREKRLAAEAKAAAQEKGREPAAVARRTVRDSDAKSDVGDIEATATA